MAIVRGNTVFFTIQFLDENREVTAVDTAELQVTYPTGTTGTEDEAVTLTSDDDLLITWRGSWESDVSEPGRVFWSAKGEGTDRTSVEDGNFKVTANVANEWDE